MDFEWDEAKNESNYKKHGIRFAEGATVWSDELACEYYDLIHSVDEPRFIKLGLSIKNRILLVIYCERNCTETIRVISARKATKSEVKNYEK